MFQDTIFNKLVKQKKFDNWRRSWEVNVRDFKPLWVCELAENIVKRNLSDPFKVVFKRDRTRIQSNPGLSKKLSQISSISRDYPDVSDETYNQRKATVKEKLFPIIKEDFKMDINKTG